MRRRPTRAATSEIGKNQKILENEVSLNGSTVLRFSELTERRFPILHGNIRIRPGLEEHLGTFISFVHASCNMEWRFLSLPA